MLRWTILVASLFALAACGGQPVTSDTAAGPSVLLEGARLISGDGSAVIENSALLVTGSLISRVGRKGEIAAPAGAKRLDLTGKTVMPALIATHVHPGFQKG